MSTTHDDELRQFVTHWRKSYASIPGSWSLFDLCWIGRVTAPDDRSSPLFPEVLEQLLDLQTEAGGLGPPSPHPYSDFVVALSLANTLVQWHVPLGRRAEPAIRGAIRYALASLERMQRPLYRDRETPYGRHWVFGGFYGNWFVPLKEGQALLSQGQPYLTEAEARALGAYVNAAEDKLGARSPKELPYDLFFEQDSTAVLFAEYFPDAVLESPAARAHALRVGGLVGYTAAGAARYYEVTRDEVALATLRRLLERPIDGLWPMKFEEINFSLLYLIKGGIDVERHCQDELEYFMANLGEEGVGIQENTRMQDGDNSSVAQFICNSLGLPKKMETRFLESWWCEKYQHYNNFRGKEAYAVTTMANVLDAYLADPETPEEHLRLVWKRTVDLVNTRGWMDLYHLSPFFVWEHVVVTIGANVHRFPEHPTNAHHEALALILENQDASGGFKSFYFDEANDEETAFAVLSLKYALEWPCGLPADKRREVAAAARRGEAFLRRRPLSFARGAAAYPPPYPPLWISMALYAPTHIVESVILASLHKPMPNVD